MSEMTIKKKIAFMAARIFIPLIIMAVVLALSVSLVLKLITKDLIVESALSTVAFKGISAQEIEEGKSVDAKIGEMIAKEIRERYNVKTTDEQVAKIMKELDVSGFLRDYLDKYCDYFYQHGELPIIDADEYFDLIEDNKETIEYIVGVKLTSSFYKYQSIIQKKVNKYNRKAGSFNNKYATLLKFQKALSSDALMTAVGAVCALLMVGYGMMRHKIKLKAYTTFRLYTFMFVILSTAVFIGKRYIIGYVAKPETLSGAVINKVLARVFNIVGYSYLGVGIIFAVLWVVFALPYMKKKS